MKSFVGHARLLVGLLLLAAAPGCAYYSFTGATVPAHLNTVAIPLAEDNSLSPLTTLDDELTDLLITRFVQQTRLSLEQNEDEADALLTIRIDRYANAPTSVSGQERAELNRITLSVSVRYYDRVEDKELLQRTFSSFADYDPLEGGLEREEETARAALENIADDIFTAATSNW
ncbi:MAG: LptE family protein [Bacteroidetes bacterium]|nr:LptE family protein [Bacteroidota bacterium]